MKKIPMRKCVATDEMSSEKRADPYCPYTGGNN